MTGDEIARAITILVALILFGSSLASHRLSARKSVRLALIWLAIFAGLFLAVTLVQDWLEDEPATTNPVRTDVVRAHAIDQQEEQTV